MILTGLLYIRLGLYAAIIPVATEPPGELAREDIPQFIFVTFDDALNPDIYEMIGRISQHQHADGSPIGFTFFISNNYTDYYLVHKLHAAGHEIATHTITHTTGGGTDFLTWVREIEGCREALYRLAGIPLADIRGFRAPFLAYSASTYEALNALGFDYSSSVSEPLGHFSLSPAEMIWPYTLHDGLQQTLWTGTGPSSSLPDLMEVPMWLLYESDGSRHLKEMDPAGSRESLVQLFKDNLLERYNGNRVPVGIWLHAAPWLGNPTAPQQEHVDALNEFLAWALQKPDVWVVGMSKVVDWMRNPLPADQAAAAGMLSPSTYEPVPESETLNNSFATGTFKSVGNKALNYPKPNNVFQRELTRKTQVHSVELEIVTTAIWSPNSRPTGFQGEIHIRNNSEQVIEDWSVIWTPGAFEVSSMWGDTNMEALPNGRIRIQPNWKGPIIPVDGQLVATFGASGDPDQLGSLEGNFTGTLTELPPFHASLQRRADGELYFRWDRDAPIYHLQQTTDLLNGPWVTIKTVYGRTELRMPKADTSAPTAFYRIQTEQ
jgi:peptidoglycan/xylan/chitin deacetylase (PgdA/CDA1 family)